MDINNLIKQAKTLKENFENEQKEFAKKTFTASSGGGMVKATVNGTKKLVDLDIDKKLYDDQDLGMMKDLVIAAVNSATDNVDDASQNMMSNMAGGSDMDLSKLGDMFK